MPEFFTTYFGTNKYCTFYIHIQIYIFVSKIVEFYAISLFETESVQDL